MEIVALGLVTWFGTGALFTWAAAKSWALRWGSWPDRVVWYLVIAGPGAVGCFLAEITIRLTADDENRALWEWARNREAKP